MANKRTTDFYRKKTHQLAQEATMLRRASAQVNEIVDGILVQIAKRYGEEVRDDDGAVIGYRIVTAIPDREDFKVEVNKKDGEYIIGIVKQTIETADDR